MNDTEKRAALALAATHLAIYDARIQSAVEYYSTKCDDLTTELTELSFFGRLMRGKMLLARIATSQRKEALYIYQSFAGDYGDVDAEDIQQEIDRVFNAIASRYNLRDIHGEYFLSELTYRQYLRRALQCLGIETLLP